MNTNTNVKKVLEIGAGHRNELWKLVRELLRLSDCNVQKLEDTIFPTIIKDDNDVDVTLSSTIYSSRSNKG